MARLKKEVQTYIVRSLAQFNTPQETADLVKEEFKIEVTRQQCEAYDPTKRIGKDLSQSLKKEFEETRKSYLEAPKNIPIANQTVRLNKPTFTPSLLVNDHYPTSRCHLFLTDGKIQFLSDCHHALAGQTVDMVEIEEVD